MSEALVNELCRDIRELLNGTEDRETILKDGSVLLANFVKNPVFMKDLFSKLITDDDFLMKLWPVMDSHEITFFRDKEGLFSLRLYVWDPAVSYPIHSHGSWGIVGCVTGEILERKYERLDHGTKPGHAKIKESNRGILCPGDITTVLPQNQGIHHMQSNTSKNSSVSLHIYGRAVEGAGVNFFNIHRNTCYRVVTPKYYNRVYAIRALNSINDDWSRELLTQALKDKKSFVREAAQLSLDNLNN